MVCSEPRTVEVHQQPLVHYVIVRDDLPPGAVMAQTIHAAGESAALRAPEHDTHAVALVANLAQLLNLERALTEAQIAYTAIREPDLDNTLTAIGIAPTTRDAVKRLISNFRLYGSQR